MKLLFFPTIFSTLLLIASFVDAAPCTADNCLKTSDGVRHYGGIGTKNWKKRVFQKTTRGWYRTEWDKVMAKVVQDHSCALEEHYPTMVAKVHWSEAYVNSTIKPTRAQARDPNWSNYVWNRTENGIGFVYDGITDALNDPIVNNGKGIGKLAILVGLTSSSGHWIPPVWMRNDSSLTWLEGNAGKWHTRFDNPKAVDHAADFLAAFMAKFGNNTGIHSIILAEYYMGVGADRPSGFSRNAYIRGMQDLRVKMVQDAPRDAQGNRVNIMQTNALFNSDVSIEDLEAIGVGMSESDTRLDLPVTNTPETAAMKGLYERKKVHVMIGGDVYFACNNRTTRWDGTPNPFGHAAGYSGVATPQELLWYHSDKGPAPSHSFFLTMGCAPQTAANYIDAIKKFGRCGSLTSKWGVAPAAPTDSTGAAGSIASGKPNPPPAVAIK